MSRSDIEMRAYYQERAPNYDNVYQYPERQKDLRFLEEYIPTQFINLKVLEIAAGTGYWTQFIAPSATSVMATDVTREALEQINARPSCEKINTKVCDAYSLIGITNSYEGLFAGLWISHVPKQNLRNFIKVATNKLSSGSPVVFIDNSRVQCERLPLSSEDEFGNTFQERPLENGKTYSVLKNFPTEIELQEFISEFGSEGKFIELDNFCYFNL